MEANRERVEEVYKEERVIMEEERTEWETEKAALLDELHNLRQHVSGLQGDNVRLQTMVQRFELEKAGKVARLSISLPGPRSGGDGPADIELSGPRTSPSSLRQTCIAPQMERAEQISRLMHPPLLSRKPRQTVLPSPGYLAPAAPASLHPGNLKSRHSFLWTQTCNTSHRRPLTS